MKENVPIYIKFKTKMLPKNDKDTLSGQQKNILVPQSLRFSFHTLAI